MNYFKHDQAIVESQHIGEGTRIWAFAHVLPDAIIGTNCNICDHVFIENDVLIGNRVTIKCGVQIWDGITLEDDVFVGPNATFTNDNFPRSKIYPEKFNRTVVRKGASIGANATILSGITVGPGAMVGAGAVVTGDVPPNAIVVGNPARISGYVSAAKSAANSPAASATADGEPIRSCSVPGIMIHCLPEFKDLRGSLSFAEYGQMLPFVPKRYFLVYDVPSKEVRGEHAHRNLHQFLVCVRGSCSVLVDDGTRREEILLDSPLVGIHIPPMVWGVQYKYSPDTMLLVLASDIYDGEDYIRDYDQFLLELPSREDT
jgi:acetyltransferase-like isoleucine patch superfamily enzyme/dTDP-4-dehydrorhamnose 3,5-epimerase-like enzyme